MRSVKRILSSFKPRHQNIVYYVIGVTFAAGTMSLLAHRTVGIELSTYNLLLSICVIGSQIVSFGLPIGIIATFRETNRKTFTDAVARSWVTWYEKVALGLAVGACVLGNSLLSVVLAVVSSTLLMVATKIQVSCLGIAGVVQIIGLSNAIRFGLQAGTFLVVLNFANTLSSTRIGLVILLGEIGVRVVLRTIWRRSQAGNENLNTTDMLKVFRTGIRQWPSVLLIDINTRVDLICLGFLGKPSDVAVYGVLVLVGDGLLSFYMIFRPEIEPIVARANRTEDDRTYALSRISQLSSRLILLTIVVFISLLLSNSIWSKILLNAGLSATSIASLCILGLATVISASGCTFAFCRGILGEHRQQNSILFAGFLGNLAINVGFVRAFGPIAAATGTLLANTAYLVNFRWVRRYLISGNE